MITAQLMHQVETIARQSPLSDEEIRDGLVRILLAVEREDLTLHPVRAMLNNVNPPMTLPGDEVQRAEESATVWYSPDGERIDGTWTEQAMWFGNRFRRDDDLRWQHEFEYDEVGISLSTVYLGAVVDRPGQFPWVWESLIESELFQMNFLTRYATTRAARLGHRKLVMALIGSGCEPLGV